MDSQAEALCHRNERAFIESFRRARVGTMGGIYLLNYDTYPLRITSANLTKVSLSGNHSITDLSSPISQGETYDLAAAASSYFSELTSDARDLAQSAQGEKSGTARAASLTGSRLASSAACGGVLLTVTR